MPRGSVLFLNKYPLTALHVILATKAFEPQASLVSIDLFEDALEVRLA
jgi:hypothetical protein